MKEEKQKKQKNGIRLYYLLATMITVTVLISVLFTWVTGRLKDNSTELAASTERYIEYRNGIDSLEAACAYLTEQARAFATIGDKTSVDAYFKEVSETRRREKGVELIRKVLGDGEILLHLQEAVSRSYEMQQTELYSMRLVIESTGEDISRYPAALSEIELTEEDANLSPYEQWRKASMMLHDEAYEEYKDFITESVDLCKDALIYKTQEQQTVLAENIRKLIILQSVVAAAILVMLAAIAICIGTQLLRPLRRTVDKIRMREELPMKGVYELRTAARVYNDVFRENAEIRDKLAYEASHDSLTGLYNRRFFENESMKVKDEECALLLVDVDYFKRINDSFGHDAGDRVLQKVAGIIKKESRPEDIVCRIGGDEFAVIVKNATSAGRASAEEKLKGIEEEMAVPEEGIPAVTLSMGLAFSKPGYDGKKLFKEADIALYQAKDNGRSTFVIRS